VVGGDPVHHGMAVAPEFLGGHVKRFFVRHGSLRISSKNVLQGCSPRKLPRN
jgi:hypothetical protein